MNQVCNIINNRYYIIRTGDFATNGNKKIMYSLVAFILCADDYYTNDSLDCLFLMTGSSMVWTLIEGLLHISKTRNIKPMFVSYSNKQVEIPKYMGICLQGIQEGGVVSTFGLYFGDRMFNSKYVILYNLLIIYMVVNMSKKQTNNKILSKRQINATSSIIFMGTITIYNGISIYNHPEHIARELMMGVSMFYISSIWTIVSYYKGFRKVGVQEYNGNRYVVKPPNFMDTFCVLGYDVVFEICIAYLTFYNWFVL